MRTNSYWDHEGPKQDLIDQLHEELVPPSGEAPTAHGEILRITERLYYDRFNNGACNFTMNYYKDMRQRLWKTRRRLGVDDKTMRRFVSSRQHGSVSDDDASVYDEVVSKVIDWVNAQNQLVKQRGIQP